VTAVKEGRCRAINDKRSFISAHGRLTVAACYLLLGGIAWRLIYSHFFNWGMAEDFLLVDWYRELFESGEGNWLHLLSMRNGSHPLAFMAVIAVSLFRIFGVNFVVLIFANFLLIGSMSFFVFDAARRSLTQRWITVYLLISCFLISFHPAQTNHILWPFEISWFLISFAITFNIWLIERVGIRALPFVVLVSLASSFSSAHGVFAWAAVGFHLWLRHDWPLRQRYTVSAAFLAVFLAAALIIAKITPAGEASFPFSEAPGLPAYLLSLVGAMFGIRDHWSTALLGTVPMIAVLWLGIHGLINRASIAASSRVGLVLIMVSLLMLLSFSLGRYRLGLPGVLQSFHSAPIIVPMFLGINMLSAGAFDRLPPERVGARAITALLSLFLLASFVSAMGYARQKSHEVVLQRAMSMEANCFPGATKYLRISLSGGGGNLDHLLDRTFPAMRHLCTEEVPDWVRKVEAFPALFTSMAVNDLKAQQALRQLWEVYLTHFDLIRAFPVTDDASAIRLLRWARDNAQSGSHYEPELLGPHAVYFLGLTDLQ
jgi:hypothetical protein